MPYGLVYMIVYLATGLAVIALGYYGWKQAKKKKIGQIFDERHQDFDTILSRHNPYYKSLNTSGRDRFLRRVLEFMESKHFQYIDLQPEETMPLLISAAAVQLTYGLDKFQLDYFTTIHILKDNYRYGLYKVPFEGHVSDDGIYLSWSNFIREFTDYSDGQNVGLHEMAHALTYVNFNVEDGRDGPFHDRFKGFSAVARPIFNGMAAGSTNLLGEYAATNYQEFWAVSVETFFERPTAFKRQMPELYNALCVLLNQDPLTADKILPEPKP